MVDSHRYHFLTDDKVMCAAVSVIWTHLDELILIRRAQREGDPWSGHIGFPGGRIEETDLGNPFKTAIRETKEEIGVSLTKFDCEKSLTPLLPEKDFRGYKLELWPYLFKIDRPSELILDPNEVQSIIRLPVERVVKNFELRESDFHVFTGQTYKLPCLELPCGSKIWGLTLMILSEINKIYGLNT